MDIFLQTMELLSKTFTNQLCKDTVLVIEEIKMGRWKPGRYGRTLFEVIGNLPQPGKVFKVNTN